MRSTARGPIVTDIRDDFGDVAAEYPKASGAPDGDYEVSLQWTALTAGTTPQAVFALNRARDWQGFRAAAALFDVPSQNLIYADESGNIGYQAPGDIPVRLSGDGTVPLPGWTSVNGWSGSIAFDELPSVLNPDSGYIVTANNPADGPDGPLLTEDWDYGYRAAGIDRLIRERIADGGKLTADDLAEMQLDTADANAATFLPLIAELDLDGDAARGAALLDGWNGRADVDSAEAAYFAVFWRSLLDDMFASLPEPTRPQGGDRWYNVVGTLLGQPDSPWWSTTASGATGRDAVIAEALAAAWLEASELMGDDPETWRWGKLHTLTLTNQSFGESGIGPDRVALQPRALRARRRLVDRERHRLGREHRVRRRLGAVDAHGRRPRRPRRVTLDQPHGRLGTRLQPALRRPGAALAARRDSARGRSPSRPCRTPRATPCSCARRG